MKGFPIKLMNILITSHVYHSLCVWERFHSLSKFPLYNMVLSTIDTMLHIWLSDLIHLITESLYSFADYAISSYPSNPGHHLPPSFAKSSSNCFSLEGPCYSLSFQSSYLYHLFGYMCTYLQMVDDLAV